MDKACTEGHSNQEHPDPVRLEPKRCNMYFLVTAFTRRMDTILPFYRVFSFKENKEAAF